MSNEVRNVIVIVLMTGLLAFVTVFQHVSSNKQQAEIRSLQNRVQSLETEVNDLSGLADPNTRIYGKFQTHTERLDRLDELVSELSPEFPTIHAYCIESSVNGHEGVAFNHPVVEITGRVVEPNLWLVIRADEPGESHPYYISFSGAPGGYAINLDGYMQSIRGTSGVHILDSETKYSLKAWRSPYTEGVPTLSEENWVFEESFEVPSCK